MRARIDSTAARTDDDVMDEAAGFARAEVAAASKARKAAEAAELAQENAEMRERIKNVRFRRANQPLSTMRTRIDFMFLPLFSLLVF